MCLLERSFAKFKNGGQASGRAFYDLDTIAITQELIRMTLRRVVECKRTLP